MSSERDRVDISLKLNKEITKECYPSYSELFKDIEKYLSGEAVGSFGDVIVSPLQPSSEDVNKVWVKTNASNNEFEIYLYINGAWKRYYFTSPNEFKWFSKSGGIPEGFKAVGEVKSSDINLTDISNLSELPSELILAKWIGY